MQGMDIKQHMRDIPQGADPAPIIRIYVDLNLQTLHKAGVISGAMPEADAPPAAAQSQAPASSGFPAVNGNIPAAAHQDAAASTHGSTAETQLPNMDGRRVLQAGLPVQAGNEPSTSSSTPAKTSPASSAGSLTSPGTQVSASVC